jgi:glycine/D-amino acid oxidase-like deaminating enzyme
VQHRDADPEPFVSRSLWEDDPGVRPSKPRPSLHGDLEVDVVIVGAGYTGLWTAYYLRLYAPQLSVAVLERARVGFGASGRNGGWCSAVFPVGLDALDRRHGPGSGARMQRAMNDTLDEIVGVCAREGIDARIARGGWIDAARNEAQVARLRAQIDQARRHGFDDDQLRWLPPDAAAERLRATRLLGATYTPHVASLHPARLVNGLAAVVERHGARIFEETAVTSLGPRVATTGHGIVRAGTVVRATEAFTRNLPGLKRQVLPVYSLMIATEPLDDRRWDQIGLTHRETFSDARHQIIYGQRTADGRLAFGGRGAPYHFGSAVDPRHDRHRRVRAALADALVDLLPPLRDVRVTHHWGGPLGISRDWHPSVHLDRVTGLADAGSYVGDGVATANLAGRTLAALVSGRDDDLTRLPWVGHRSRRWEPEPLRWLGINAALRAAMVLDRLEERGGGSTRRAFEATLRRLTGH